MVRAGKINQKSHLWKLLLRNLLSSVGAAAPFLHVCGRDGSACQDPHVLWVVPHLHILEDTKQPFLIWLRKIIQVKTCGPHLVKVTVMPLSRKKGQPRCHVKVMLINFLVTFFFLSHFALEPMPKMHSFYISLFFGIQFSGLSIDFAFGFFLLLGVYSSWLWSLHFIESQ